MKITVLILCLITFALLLANCLYSLHKVEKERDFLQEKLERFEARYKTGDLEHTIQFEHTCGHKELFSLNGSQIYHLSQLQAHSCYDCRKQNDEL